MLIVFGGLPGVGKTTIARELARQIGAVFVRIDSIEYGIRQSAREAPVEDAGYRAAYAVAEDNLRAGLTVIADSVNPLQITRDAWRGVALRAGVPVVEVEVVCSDANEHRRRVETRPTDFPGWTLTWQEVVDREYHPWDRDRIVLDTSHTPPADHVATLLTRIQHPAPAPGTPHPAPPAPGTPHPAPPAPGTPHPASPAPGTPHPAPPAPSTTRTQHP